MKPAMLVTIERLQPIVRPVCITCVLTLAALDKAASRANTTAMLATLGLRCDDPLHPRGWSGISWC